MESFFRSLSGIGMGEEKDMWKFSDETAYGIANRGDAYHDDEYDEDYAHLQSVAPDHFQGVSIELVFIKGDCNIRADID